MFKELTNKLCDLPKDRPMLVGGAVILLGVSQLGYGDSDSMIGKVMAWGIGPSWLTIGNLAGVTCVVVGGCMLITKITGAVE